MNPKPKNSDLSIYEGTGNVFEDLNLPDAKEHDLKAQIAFHLNEAIADLHSSQKDIAKILDIKQPHVSHLMNYKLQGFSTERLMLLLVKLGHSIRIQVSGLRTTDAHIGVCVTCNDPIGASSNEEPTTKDFSATWGQASSLPKRSPFHLPTESDNLMFAEVAEIKKASFAFAPRSLQ